MARGIDAEALVEGEENALFRRRREGAGGRRGKALGQGMGRMIAAVERFQIADGIEHRQVVGGRGLPATIVRERGAGFFSNKPGEIAEQLVGWLEIKQDKGLPREWVTG